MKTIIRISVILLTAILLIVSCKHDPIILPASTDINGNTAGNGNSGTSGSNNNNSATCSPDTVYFQNDILPLFISNCAKSGCHDASTHKEGKVYESYASIMNTGDIRPFRLSGKTYKVITTNDPDDRMPPSPYASLNSGQISLIETWINQGAQNNVCNSGTCDTTSVTYSGTIAPLLQSHCTGCHGNNSPGGNINLLSFSGVQTVALNGRLFGSVDHMAGYSAMPKNSARMPDCEIAQIRIWIQHGALNN